MNTISLDDLSGRDSTNVLETATALSLVSNTIATTSISDIFNMEVFDKVASILGRDSVLDIFISLIDISFLLSGVKDHTNGLVNSKNVWAGTISFV
ncbi:MAG: hypothetical protein ISR98_01505 [Parcubacteria group bacterium]|nr:hypothetical protein [Parcubacteria group bacterium]